MMEVENIFVLVGIILVVFFGILLLTSRKYRSRPNAFLAFSLLSLAAIMIRISGLFEELKFTELFELLRVEYIFSGFIYLYVCFTLKEKIKYSTYILLGIPFLFFSSLYSIMILSDTFGEEVLGSFVEEIEPYEIYIIIVFNFLVLLGSLLKIKRSQHEASLKKWMYLITTGLIAILCFAFILELIELWFDVNAWNSFGIILSFFFIAISYYGVQKLQIVQEQKIIKQIYKSKKVVSTTSKSTITLGHFERMKQLMEAEELFRNSNLDRSILAKKLNLSESSITRILKEEGQLSFKNFVNQYRIQLAKNMLTDSQYDIFSLEAIGKEVGFKSRSTFYETFKKEVGISPGAYKKQ